MKEVMGNIAEVYSFKEFALEQLEDFTFTEKEYIKINAKYVYLPSQIVRDSMNKFNTMLVANIVNLKLSDESFSRSDYKVLTNKYAVIKHHLENDPAYMFKFGKMDSNYI